MTSAPLPDHLIDERLGRINNSGASRNVRLRIVLATGRSYPAIEVILLQRLRARHISLRDVLGAQSMEAFSEGD